MARGMEFFVFYFCCVALWLILSGLYIIIKRFVLRRNGTPVTIVYGLASIALGLGVFLGMLDFVR